MGQAADLFLGSDDDASVLPALSELLSRLREAGYERTAVLPMAGHAPDICLDPVNATRAVRGRSNLFHASAAAGVFAAGLGLAARRAVELHALLFAGRPRPEAKVNSLLGTELTTRLVEAKAMAVTHGVVEANILVAPFAGNLYLSDPVRLQDHAEYCYLGRSTFTVPEFLGGLGVDDGRAQNAGEGKRLLDLACGAGVGAIACASGFDEVVGTDVVPRCLRFARLNAALNGATGIDFHESDVFSAVVGEFDLIVCNTPCVWADTEPGQPRTYASGGADFGLELPTRMISGALERLRPGGTVLAVVSAPIIRGDRYVVKALDRICARRAARVVVYPLLEEYELRSARHYRRHCISKVVRYLVMLRPARSYSVSFGRFDTARLLSCRVRTLPPRLLAGVTRP